jgi:DNA polymerase-1
MPPRLYIIDSHGQLYASYYAIRGLTTPRGEPIGAAFGFVGTLLKVLREEDPDHLVACFDSRGPTVRHEEYEDYKAQRKPMPEDLGPQIEYARRILDLRGVASAEVPGYEADDCIAALTERARDAGFEVVICSRDKDLEQLVGPGVRMLDTKNFEMLDSDGIREKRGVEPEQMTDVLALMGDASDNIPGVPGIGAKTAVKLIGEHGSLEALLEKADRIKGKLGERLREHREDALRSRELVRLRADLPLDLDPGDCRLPDDFDRSALVECFRELGFNRFIEEFDLEGTGGGGEVQTHLVETEQDLRKLAAELAEQDAFAFDTETTGVDPRRAELVGLSFAWSDAEGYYVPVRALENGRCLPIETVREALGPVLASADRLLVGQNLKYDLLVCRTAGLDVAEPLFDTMVAAYLVNPGRREYGLDALALDYFGHTMIPLTDLLGEKKSDRTMAEVPVEAAAEYAAEDAVVTWRLKGRLEAELEEAGLAKLACEVEMPLVPVLAEMEDTGVAIDTGVLEEISADLGQRLGKLEQEIYEEAGHEFLINSPQQLATVLFDEIGLKPLKKTASGSRPSTAAAVLEELAHRHPLPRLILAYRQLAKLKSTYVDALPQLVDPNDGRVHASFNQTVTATGRLSSSDPNLQNIPIRTDEGRQIRRAFVPGPEGWVLMAMDYSQIELRMLAHYSGDEQLVRAFQEDRDIHSFVAAQIHGVDEDDVTYDMRRVAKVVNFSLIYGKTAYGLSRDLSIGVGEAERFIDDYFDRYRGVRAFTAEVLERAKDQGYVTTILGRRRYIEGIDKMDPKRLNFPERTAINTVIQGSAADLIKVAMNRIARRIDLEDRPSRLLIQIHDELIFEAPADAADDEAEWITGEMTDALDLAVPLKVNVATGTNWMEAE